MPTPVSHRVRKRRDALRAAGLRPVQIWVPDTRRPGFAAELMLKDLRLSQMAAAGADADTPMGQLATELYSRFVEDEDGRGRDFSAMLPRFERRHRSG